MSEVREVAERIVTILDHTQNYTTMYATIDTIEYLDLTPDECTMDVLQAVWAIADEVTWSDDAPDHWCQRLFEYVEELLEQP